MLLPDLGWVSSISLPSQRYLAMPRMRRWEYRCGAAYSHRPSLVVPGSHVIGGDCIERVGIELLSEAAVKSLDTGCVSGILPPTFIVTAVV